MITKENIKKVLRDLSPNTIERALNEDGDYVEIWLHTPNSGFFVTLTPHHYDSYLEKEASDNGMLFISKDDFKQLLQENNICY